MLDKAKVSYRIATSSWDDDYHFNNLYNLFKEYADKIDEIALFLSFTHSSLPLDRIEELSKVAKVRMEEIRKLGIRTGINHLTTIGHHAENLDNSLQGDYGRHIDYNEYHHNSLCVSDPKVKEYIGKTYEIIALANPDYIWIDDDLGMYWHFNCFCDNCIAEFSKKGVSYTKESLKYAFDNGTREEKKAIREKWLEFNVSKITSTLSIIRNSVDKINPNINIGLMSADFDYENIDRKIFSDILSRNNTIATMWRPGCGYYNDWDSRGFYVKANLIGRLIAPYPDYVTDIQSEIENFPYNNLHKSVHMNIMETCAYIGAGCTGVAYNVLNSDSYNSEYDTTWENTKRFKGILAKRDFMDLLVKTFKRNKNRGVFFEYTKDSMFGMRLDEGKWLEGGGKKFQYELFENGIPIAYSKDKTGVTMLLGDEPNSMSEDQIIELLSGGVFMDAKALDILNKLGYGKYLGFSLKETIERDCIEKFTDHKFNKDIVGYERDCRQSFGWSEPAYSLNLTDEKSEIISSLVDYVGKEKAKVTMGIFENSLGGRICVAGYFPQTYVQSYARSLQMKRVMRYLSKDKLNSYIGSYHNILMFDRTDKDVAMLIINNSYDKAENVKVCVAGDIKEINICDVNLNKTLLKQSCFDGSYSEFIIPEMDMFSMLLIN